MEQYPTNINHKDIAVIDFSGSAGYDCKCSEDAKFLMVIHGHQMYICEICIGELGKRIIDGLV